MALFRRILGLGKKEQEPEPVPGVPTLSEPEPTADNNPLALLPIRSVDEEQIIPETFHGQKEILAKPVDLLIVHADDEPRYNAELDQNRDQLFSDLTLEGETVDILYADRWEKVFALALTGNAGEQAHIVILDDNYRSLGNEWSIDPERLKKLLEQMGINIPEGVFDFSYRPDQLDDLRTKMVSIKREITVDDIQRGDESRNYMPGRLFGGANSADFAILLRLLGYQGKIIILSNDPPRPKDIAEKISEVNKALETDLTFPVDACLAKRIRGGILQISDVRNGTFKSNPSQYIWNDIDVSVGSLADGVNYAIKQLK